MKAVLFAAGLGTRLGELTRHRPKALVEVAGRPMLYRVLDRLMQAGIRSFVVNVHAFADRVEAALEDYALAHPAMHYVVSDERDQLLETGGGLKKMERYLQDGPFLVHNVDVLTNLPLEAFVAHAGQSLATLAVRRCQSDRYFLFDSAGRLCGWENVLTGEKILSRPSAQPLERYGFMGIHCIRPDLFPLLTEQGAFSITKAYLRLAADHEITAYEATDCHWIDIGTPASLQHATHDEKNYTA